MNSRERVKKVINHEIPDKIPVDFGGTPSTSISPIAYHKLRKELGLKNKLFYIPNFVFQSVYPEDEILEKFNIDIIDAGRAFIESIDWKIWKLNDDIGCFIPGYIDLEINLDGDSVVKNKDGFVVAKKRKGSLYFDQCSFPYENLDSIPIKFNDYDLRKTTTNYWNIPIMPLHLDIFEKSQNNIFVNTIKNLYEKSDKAISLLVGCPLMEEGKSLRGVENFYCDIYKDQKGTERLMDTLLYRYLELLTRLLEGVGKYINILRFADDLGFQEGPIISP
ncbi:MAG: hypothetical protein M1308_15495 [Actinobacteria bacterium]|nr:hypothetical protein [Actinomycetota bacterium]